ncbi:hypothetical protein CEP54_006492 [Fusarium duplospermum]|uniref:Uncharacterized protein n=1 Tax=Fusarium duplospermum TaxID=1325734 RepID=A0A428Q6T3_9HYPO|nr:hypothetical protein CEP54_006492 [Fusarium duplospermum]
MTESTSSSQQRAQGSVSNPSIAPETAPKLISGVTGTTPDDIESSALFSDYLGLSIAPLNQPTHEGTKGLYLRRKDTGDILLLTCRHVVFWDELPNKEYRHDGTKESWAIIQPGEDTLRERKHSMELSIGCETSRVERLEKGSDLPEEMMNIDARMQSAKLRIALCEQELSKLQELDDPASRIIGHVVFSPPYSLGTSKMGARHLRNWALIELHQGKHETELPCLRNKIFTGEVRTRPRLISYDRLNHAGEVGDTVAEEELRDPNSATPPLSSPIVVMKHGAATDLTTGSVAEALSIVRRTHGNVTFEFEEWCVLGDKERWDGLGRRKMFSAAGDSGSCVFDQFGRVFGISSGGGELGDDVPRNESGYFTPIEWLLDDIRAHGYDVELLPRGLDW